MAQVWFDLIVIGSGPAGQKAALTAAELGKRVALVDRRTMIGGVCIHTGTIPSKAIREAVLHLAALNERNVYGAGYAVKHDIRMADLLARANFVIANETEVVQSQMRRAGVSLFYGRASFAHANAIHVENEGQSLELHSHNVLIACGTEPARPNHVPFTPGKIIDSNELLDLMELPKSITIVGGGVIGTEYACMLAVAGVKVTLLDARPRLLEFLDEELTETLQFRLRDMGVRLCLNEKVDRIELAGNDVECHLKSGKTLRSETLLYCVGRQGATRQLSLELAGLEADDRGRLKVNEMFQTSVPHIYAAGDVIGFPALAATSMEQGRQAALYMFSQPMANETPKIFPYGIYSIPEISVIGQSEQQLSQSNTPYEVGIARYREIARGQILGDPTGILKLLFHPQSRRLLGVHALGTGATELIHIGQAVMAAGLPIDYFVETVFNYPTLAECYKVAALDGLSRCGVMKSKPAADADTTADAPPLISIDKRAA